MNLAKTSTKEIRALLDTCHRLGEFDGWFDALAREYRQRQDRQSFEPLRGLCQHNNVPGYCQLCD